MAIYWIASYLIGNLLTAWWVGKWKGVDLRNELSGNLGARNAGAVIGKTAFFLTFLGDAAKVGIVVWIGHYFSFEIWIIAVAALAAICGHLFPVWLKGRGGKGIASFIGAALILTPSLFLVMAAVFAAFLPFVKSATLTMLLSFFAYAVSMFWFSELPNFWPLLAAMALILIKHVPDIKESFEIRFNKY